MIQKYRVWLPEFGVMLPAERREMTTIEQQVTNRQLSEALAKAGYPQEGIWWWNPGMTNNKVWWEILRHPTNYGSPTKPKKAIAVIAPTCSELIYLLGDKFGVLERFQKGGFGCYIPNDCGTNGMGDTPVNALAELWFKTNKAY